MIQKIRSVAEIAGDYALSVGSLTIKVPYWINWDLPPYFKDAPLRGKGTPEELLTQVRQVIGLSDGHVTQEEATQILKRAGLGIDCSGFAYHTLDTYLGQFGLDIASGLAVTADEIMTVLKEHHDRGQLRLGTSLPQRLPLRAVARLWGSNPVMISSVRRLTAATTADKVSTAGEICPGDLIRMTSSSGDHVAVVTQVHGVEITYVAAEDEADGPGGVRSGLIVVRDPSASLEAQVWRQRHLFDDARDGVWRLHILDQIRI